MYQIFQIQMKIVLLKNYVINNKMSTMSIHGKVSYRAPSNIAFVKYWGKMGRQLPMNPSISMSLSTCHTETEIAFTFDEEITNMDSDSIIKSFNCEGLEPENQIAFKTRLESYLQAIEDLCPFLKHMQMDVKSKNSFPHSAGIASSASGMAAFALCLAKIENKLNQESSSSAEDIKKRASILARIASGSACRSVFANYALWGKLEQPNGNDEFAVSLDSVHESFEKVADTILIIDSGKKDVSSSAGHGLMNTHPFNDVRFDQAKDNAKDIYSAMKAGDWKNFGEILELEALTLHGLMMSSSPSFVLLKPNSLKIIELVREFREETKTPLYFTIDAGPNMHLIYPLSHEDEIKAFINKKLKIYCENEMVIFDSIGTGPEELYSEFNREI